MVVYKPMCRHERRIALETMAVCSDCGQIVPAGNRQIFDEGVQLSMHDLLEDLVCEVAKNDKAIENAEEKSAYQYHRGKRDALLSIKRKVELACASHFETMTKPNMN